jgi:plastocyanin
MAAAASMLPPSMSIARLLAQEAAAPRAEVVQIVIDKVAFTPLKRPLKVGDVVEFVNNDVVDHTATEKNKAWDVVIRVGRKARVEMKTAGAIDYYCRYHPNMTGRISVQR